MGMMADWDDVDGTPTPGTIKQSPLIAGTIKQSPLIAGAWATSPPAGTAMLNNLESGLNRLKEIWGGTLPDCETASTVAPARSWPASRPSTAGRQSPVRHASPAAVALGREEDQLLGHEGIHLDLECGGQRTSMSQGHNAWPFSSPRYISAESRYALVVPNGRGERRAPGPHGLHAEDSQLLAMLENIASGAHCEDDLECPLSATVGQLLPSGALARDPHVAFLADGCEEARADFEAKRDMQKKLQAELEEVQHRRELQFQESNMIVERVRVARNHLYERLNHAAIAQEALQKRVNEERRMTVSLQESLTSSLKLLSTKAEEIGRQSAELRELQARLVDEYQGCTSSQVKLQTELSAERAAARRQSVDVVRAFARGGVPASALCALEASAKGAEGVSQGIAAEKNRLVDDKEGRHVRFEDLLTEKRASESSMVDDVPESAFHAYAEKLAVNLSNGHDDVKQKILSFMEEQQHIPCMDEPAKSKFPPAEYRLGDDEMERLTIEISVQKSGESFHVSSKSRCSVVTGLATAKLQAECDVRCVSSKGAFNSGSSPGSENAAAEAKLWAERAAWLQARVAGAEELAQLEHRVWRGQQRVGELGKELALEQSAHTHMGRKLEELKELSERTELALERVAEAREAASASSGPTSWQDVDVTGWALEAESLWNKIRMVQDQHNFQVQELEYGREKVQEEHADIGDLRKNIEEQTTREVEDCSLLEQEKTLLETLCHDVDSEKVGLEEEEVKAKSKREELQHEISEQKNVLAAHRATVTSWNTELDARLRSGCCKRRQQPSQSPVGGTRETPTKSRPKAQSRPPPREASGSRGQQPKQQQQRTLASGGNAPASSSSVPPSGSRAPASSSAPAPVSSASAPASSSKVSASSSSAVPKQQSSSSSGGIAGPSHSRGGQRGSPEIDEARRRNHSRTRQTTCAEHDVAGDAVPAPTEQQPTSGPSHDSDPNHEARPDPQPQPGSTEPPDVNPHSQPQPGLTDPPPNPRSEVDEAAVP